MHRANPRRGGDLPPNMAAVGRGGYFDFYCNAGQIVIKWANGNKTMKYQYIETPFGKSKIAHRFTSDEMHTPGEKFKTRDGRTYVRMLDGHIVRTSQK